MHQLADLHMFVMQAEKHLHVPLDAERRYLAMLERASKMFTGQFIDVVVINTNSQKRVGTNTTRIDSLDSLGFYS
ncbi:hypothetical protein NC653_015220 [Populus alba x Populus x berolinensis]|uniref:Uncharacterized protein n=1 Tax=Populus alba x Populus x berolinensis TaxID=444605 RepID=A0AAD6QK60_9ROSI|nr:hypothetical protein NC653_015220 [Populus alba x Populus x berolinensis]